MARLLTALDLGPYISQKVILEDDHIHFHIYDPRKFDNETTPCIKQRLLTHCKSISHEEQPQAPTNARRHAPIN